MRQCSIANKLLAVALLILLQACTAGKKAALPRSFPTFYKEGHRGARGLMPENTVPAMLAAVDAGANVLEVDVYLTADSQVLVAHDPYLNKDFSLLPNGTVPTKEEAQQYVWHRMPYSDIQKIDVGSRPYPQFPLQHKMVATMPLLGALIAAVERHTTTKKLPPVVYNIELKTSPAYDSSGYNAPPDVLVRAVLQEVAQQNIGRRFYLQSFDVRPLQYAHKAYPKVTLGFLTGSKGEVAQNIKALGFVPQVYSPHFSLVSAATVQACKQHGMKLVPWTVNEKEKIKELVALGVDGIITDYPNYLSDSNGQ